MSTFFFSCLALASSGKLNIQEEIKKGPLHYHDRGG
jgi:hypothetical protein